MGKKNKNQVIEKKHIQISLKQIFVSLVVLWIISLFAVWFIAKREDFITDFPMLNPRLKTVGVNNTDQEARKSKFFSTLIPLKEDVLSSLGAEKENTAFYIEDLNSGSWVGWQEREPFIAASLLKTPVAIAVMKKIDNNEWSLSQEFQIKKEYKDSNFGDLWKVEDNASVSIEKLLEEMLQNSDNTATTLFLDKLTPEEMDNVYYHIGVANPEGNLIEISKDFKVSKLSAKDDASIFRALYNSTYVTRASSNYILYLLTKTKFDAVVPRAIPQDISVAHKIGNYFNPDPTRPKNYHDCGIVYYPEHPYLYCIMTQNLEANMAETIISRTSQRVYNFFDSGGKIE